MTQVRVLSDTVINGHPVKCNRVAEVDAKTAKALEAGGQADSNKDAVAYALGENAEVVDCTQAPAGSEPAADAPAAEAAAADATAQE